MRWPLTELAAWLDEGVAAIVAVKPSAASTTMELSLQRGTHQTLPENPAIIQLLDITRNAQGTNGAGGRMVRAVSRAELDANEPRWHDPAYVPFRKEVRHFVFEPVVQRDFYVFPGNDGSGKVLAIVAKLPDTVASRHVGDELSITTWQLDVGLSDQYAPALLDYILYRSLSKEDLAASPERAMAHYQAFATAIGLKSQVEGATSPGR